MADDPIPADLRDFILRYIDSIAHLEALLLLRASLETSWEVAAVAARLYSSTEQAGEVLAQLCDEHLLVCEDGIYRYAGQPPEHLAMIDRLAESYAKQLIPITNMIHSKPRRIRQFADAFKFRKDR
jgi:hypothetical protein